MNALPAYRPLAPRAYGVTDTSRITGLGRTKIYELLASGDLKSIKIGAKRLILAESIDRLFASRAEAAN